MTTNEDVQKDKIENIGFMKTDIEDKSNVENDHGISDSDPKRMSVLSYVMSELTRGYGLERDKDKFTERRQIVYTFMRTPRELEKISDMRMNQDLG